MELKANIFMLNKKLASGTWYSSFFQMYLESFLYLSEDKKSKLENAKGKYIIFYKNIYKNIE